MINNNTIVYTLPDVLSIARDKKASRERRRRYFCLKKERSIVV